MAAGGARKAMIAPPSADSIRTMASGGARKTMIAPPLADSTDRSPSATTSVTT
jgi:hypothetical protein